MEWSRRPLGLPAMCPSSSSGVIREHLRRAHQQLRFGSRQCTHICTVSPRAPSMKSRHKDTTRTVSTASSHRATHPWCTSSTLLSAQSKIWRNLCCRLLLLNTDRSFCIFRQLQLNLSFYPPPCKEAHTCLHLHASQTHGSHLLLLLLQGINALVEKVRISV